jgi:hypothetical protein
MSDTPKITNIVSWLFNHHTAQAESTRKLDDVKEWLEKLNQLVDVKEPNERKLNLHLSKFDRINLDEKKSEAIDKYIFANKLSKKTVPQSQRLKEISGELLEIYQQLEENKKIGEALDNLIKDLDKIREKSVDPQLINPCNSLGIYFSELITLFNENRGDEKLYQENLFIDFTRKKLQGSDVEGCLKLIRRHTENIDLPKSQFLIEAYHTEIVIENTNKIISKVNSQIEVNTTLKKRILDVFEEISDLTKGIERETIFSDKTIKYVFGLMLVSLITFGLYSLFQKAQKDTVVKEQSMQRCETKVLPNPSPKNAKERAKIAEDCLNSYLAGDPNKKEQLKESKHIYEQLKEEDGEEDDISLYLKVDFTNNLYKGTNEYSNSIKLFEKIISGQSSLSEPQRKKEQIDAGMAVAYILSREAADSKKQQKKNEGRTEKFYTMILEKDKNNLAALSGKCNSHFNKEEKSDVDENLRACEDLVKKLDKIIKENRNNRKRDENQFDEQLALADYGKGCIFMRLRKYREAEKSFGRINEETILNNPSALYTLRLAYFYSMIFLSEGHSKAINYYDELVKGGEFKDKSLEFKLGVGIAHFALGRNVTFPYEKRKFHYSKAKENFSVLVSRTKFVETYLKKAIECEKNPYACSNDDVLQDRDLFAHMHSKFTSFKSHSTVNNLYKKIMNNYDDKKSKNSDSSVGKTCAPLKEDS